MTMMNYMLAGMLGAIVALALYLGQPTKTGGSPFAEATFDLIFPIS